MDIKTIVVTALGLLLANPAMSSVVVDGNLSDWGVTVADNNASDFSSPSVTGFLGSHDEDTNDNSNSYFIGPNYGGQNYDAEFMGIAIDGGQLFIGIASGQRPDNGFAGGNTSKGQYSPGDIRIVTDIGTFGIEVGGGAVNSDGTSALGLGGDGSTYALASNGYTTGHTAHDNTHGQTAGSVWKTDSGMSAGDWYLDPISPSGPTQVIAGTKVGMASAYTFTLDSLTSQHSVIEAAFELSLFTGLGVTKFESFHWRPSCGNDELNFNPPSVPLQVNEPAAIALFGLSLAGFGFGFVRRRRTKA